MDLQNRTEDEFERCVCGCDMLTGVRKDVHIDERANYVEGVGQLLPECYERIYGPSPIEETRAKLWLQEMGFVL